MGAFSSAACTLSNVAVCAWMAALKRFHAPDRIIGAQRITVVPTSAGRVLAPGHEETVEKVVQDLGDFHQPSSEGAHSAPRRKIFDGVGPLMDRM
jgi:hypothetical protein